MDFASENWDILWVQCHSIKASIWGSFARHSLAFLACSRIRRGRSGCSNCQETPMLMLPFETMSLHIGSFSFPLLEISAIF
jgi:hypothetical protein